MSDRRAAFRALHHAGRPLLLPNAWDHASAAALAEQGHPAIGTTSLGVAAAAGRPDGAAATAAETLALARRLAPAARRWSPWTWRPASAMTRSASPAYVAELAGLGVVGVNLEDGRPDGTLADPGSTAAKIAAIKAAVPDLFVNARTDTWWLGVADPLAQTLARARAYRAAGADGIFVPGISHLATLRVLAARDRRAAERAVPARRTGAGRPGPARGGPGQHRLAAVPGRARRHVVDRRRAAPGGVDESAGLPSYAQVQRLVTTPQRPDPDGR